MDNFIIKYAHIEIFLNQINKISLASTTDNKGVIKIKIAIKIKLEIHRKIKMNN